MNEANGCGIRVLAIDEEAEMLTRIADILEGAGHACQCARDAEGRSKRPPARSPI